MAIFQKEMKTCHVCLNPYPLNDDRSAPPRCPACGTDLANPGGETLQNSTDCDYGKGRMDTAKGVLYVTNTRVFWIKTAVSAQSLGGGLGKDEVKTHWFKRDTVEEKVNPLSTIITAGIASKLLSKGAGTASVDIPLSDIARLEDFKRGMRKGVTLHTRSGGSYDFTVANLSDPQVIVNMLAPYANG